MQCEGTTTGGTRCRAQAVRGGTHCFKHAKDPAVRRASDEANRAGGRARAGQLTRPFAEPLTLDVAGLDLTTPAGLTAYVAAALGRLADLPFSERTANAIAQLVGVQRVALEATDLERRVAALEARKPGPRVA